ncbi:carbonate dehydratase [Leptolyngbya sp. 'hensonii']|uniref:carbonic anhydrase n=1 Tax=Leptolyngbya sp. 'hensonii' TaxID=1922337 RepID=UPI00094F5C5F|nr:carbonic anhydrase [Leptolyngbya sp. 'hensonii']OLP15483.1 carbonate dehydratase [Leptolyngbya sp. 'hensonii']
MRKLIKGVHQFQSTYFKTHREFFEELSKEQHPRILFITCSDSRINPHLITQTEPGELFIIRNVGNIIPPYGAATGGEAAAIEYAIEILDIREIVVCGHSNCGAIQGLFKRQTIGSRLPSLSEWLKYAESTRRVVEENFQNLEGDDLVNAAIEEHVLIQIENLRTYPSVNSKLYRGQLNIHAWVYKIETGGVSVYSTERCNIEAEHEPVDPSTMSPVTH